MDNALSEYILENREAMVQAVRPAVYRVMTEHAAALCTHCSWLYPLFPKRLAYALLHYQILANHAGGMEFAQTMRPEGEELDFGGLLGYGPVMKINRQSPSRFINRGGQIPAPIQSLKN